MTRTLLTSMCACLLTTGVLAQSDPTRKMDAKGTEMTVTGCLAQGADANHYTLMNAMPNADSKGSAANMQDVKSVTYDLMGGGDLKAHLGHKIEVTGTTVAPDMHKDTAASKEPAPRNAMGKGGSEMHAALNVKAVKMVANSCS